MLEDAAGSRWFHNQLSPGELKLDGDYGVAQQRLDQQLNYPMGGYVADPKFRQELFAHFGLTQSRAQADNANANYKARHDARIAAEQQQAAAASKAGQPSWVNDPTSIATRRCLELGGSQGECLGRGIKAGLFGLLGVNTDELTNTLKGPEQRGLRLTGSYKGSGVLLTFGEGTVSINGCGKLVGVNDPYSVQKLGKDLAIRIENQPQPILAALRWDGEMSAPAAADVTGQVVIGYQNVVVQERYADGNIVPGSAHVEQQPIYTTKTQRCAIGPLRPGPPAPPDKDVIGTMADIFAALSDVADSPSGKAASHVKVIPPGPRLSGVYAGRDGLKIEFHSAGAVIDCKEAHAAESYVVSNAANGVLVSLNNAAAPLTLTLQPNGSLLGSGSIEVAGRLVAGMNGDDVVFTPVTRSCSVGTLMPH
jgi:hypothetical protein